MRSIGSVMSLRVVWVLVITLAVNIAAEIVYRFGSQYGREPEPLTEAQQTPVTSSPLLQAVPCSGVNGQGSCLERVPSSGGGGDPFYQADSPYPTSFPTEAAFQDSRQELTQLGDAYRSATFFNPISTFHGSYLVPNVQRVVVDEIADNDGSAPRFVLYGSIYRLAKFNSLYNRGVLYSGFDPTISSAMTSMSAPVNDDHGYRPGFSGRNYAAQQSDPSNLPGLNVRNPALNGMIISSGPMIRFVTPSPSPEPLVTPTDDTPEPEISLTHSDKCRAPNKLASAIKFYLARKNSFSPVSRPTKPSFTQLGNVYSSSDSNDRTSNIFTASKPTEMQPTASSFNLSLNPYFITRQSGRFRSLLKPPRNLMSDTQAKISGFQFGPHSESVVTFDPVQN